MKADYGTSKQINTYPKQVDALKELVLAPTCSPDLLAVVLADDAAATGRANMQKRGASHDDRSGDAAIPRDPAVVEEHLLSQGQDSHKRARTHETATGPERSVPLEHISIQVRSLCRSGFGPWVSNDFTCAELLMN